MRLLGGQDARADGWRHLQPRQHGALERIDEAILLVDDGEANGREAQPVGEQQCLGRHELCEGHGVLRLGHAAHALDRRMEQRAPAPVALKALEPQRVGWGLTWLGSGWGLTWLGSGSG